MSSTTGFSCTTDSDDNILWQDSKQFVAALTSTRWWYHQKTSRPLANAVNKQLPSNSKQKFLRSHSETRHFSPFQTAQTGSAAYPDSYSIGTGRGGLSWGKAAGCGVYRSSPTSAEVKNKWRYISTSRYVFMAQRRTISPFCSTDPQMSTIFQSWNSFK